MAQKDDGFHQPFAKLKVRQSPKKSEAPAPARKQTPGPPTDAASEEALFAEAMRDVGTIAGPNRIVATRELTARPIVDDDAEVEAELADLVSGSGEFDLADTSEFIEGAAHGLDPNLLRRLRAGDYAVQATLDLHGLTRDEARKAVATFVDRERTTHHRSVLIIHGRGLHSKDHIPVLKDEIKVWLARGRTGRGVLAFCSARPCDGGVGALYVLLRKPR